MTDPISKLRADGRGATTAALAARALTEYGIPTSRGTIYRMVSDGRLPGVRIGADEEGRGGRVFVLIDGLEELIRPAMPAEDPVSAMNAALADRAP